MDMADIVTLISDLKYKCSAYAQATATEWLWMTFCFTSEELINFL